MSFFFLHHPTEADLALFAGGEAGPLARWRIERHLDRCGSCGDVVADFFHLQSDLGEIAEVPQLDWNAFARRIKAAAAQAESPAVEARPSGANVPTEAPALKGWFGRPAAWGVGLASATAICGFVVFQQIPRDALPLETTLFSNAPKQERAAPFAEATPAGPLLKESAARAVDEIEEGLSAAPAERLADALELGAAATPIDANKKNVGQPQKLPLAAQNDEVAQGALIETEEVVARVAADTPAETKQRENFARGASFERGRESDLRADKVSETGNRRSVSAATRDEDSQRKGRRQTAGGALALALETRNEEDRDRLGGEIPPAVRVVSAAERGAESALTKAKSPDRRAEKTAVAEAEYETASADHAKQKHSAQNAPPAPPPADRRESGEQTPSLQAALETSEVAGVFRGGGDELRRAIAKSETARRAKDDSPPAPASDGDLSLLPVGLLGRETEIGVAADGSMSIRTLDSATNTVTITHVYLP